MNLKKIGVLFLASILLVSLAACNTTPKESGTSQSVPSESSQAEKKMFEGLPEENYGGREVQFLVAGDQMGVRYYSREILADEDSEDVINTAVLERNRIVEDKFNIKIKGFATTPNDNIVTMIRTMHDSQDDTYDILAPAMDDAAILAAEGFFHNLKDIQNMRIDGEWWDQKANSDLEIMGKLYFTTGYISILDNECTQCLIFNKNVAKKFLGDINLYDVVKKGEWTIDKMVEIARMATTDDDGEPGFTSKDTWGMYINTSSPQHMFIAAGQRYIEKDGAGNPIITINRSGAVDAINKLAELMGDRQASIVIEDLGAEASAEGFSDVYFLASARISTGKALLRTMCLIDLWEIADSNLDFDFGILPLPKYNKEQENYYSNVSTWPVPGYSISIHAKDKELSALVLSALSEASETTLNEAYYEKLLKRRHFQDEESGEMLDIIFKNRVYDLGIVFNWGDIENLVWRSVTGGTNTFASTWDSSKNAVETAMQRTIDAFEALS